MASTALTAEPQDITSRELTLQAMFIQLLRRHGAPLVQQAAAQQTSVDELIRRRLLKVFGVVPLDLTEIPGLIETNRLTLDIPGHACVFDGQPVHLPPIQFKLLALLAGNAGRVLTKEEIACILWPGHPNPNDGIRTGLATLRDLLGVEAKGGPIYTIQRGGYKYFERPVA